MNTRIVTGALAAAMLLAGCGDSDVREVRDWMEQVKRDTRPAVKPLPEPKDFLPYAYGARQAVDPFNPSKLLGELARAAATSNNPNQPDLQRPREQLETYPLDTMQMVGTMEKGGVRFALLQVDRSLYQVRTGQRIGQNFGVVAHVGEDAGEIRELVPDAAGDGHRRLSKRERQPKANRT